MKKEIAQFIVDQSDSLELYEDYSGRNMFGKPTTAITGTDEEFREALANALSDTVDDMITESNLNGVADEKTEMLYADLLNVLRDYRMDSLGMEQVFY
jgi:hypothetical protein